MLLMCLPFVIYSASMQMFIDSLGSATVARVPGRTENDR
jgi:hypothetical protein